MKTYKTTIQKLERIAKQYEWLQERAWYYVRAKFPNQRSGEVRIEDGRIQEEINTACHCHPEYEWQDRGSLEDLAEWLRQ